jgi:uncharacterized protein
MQLLKPFRSAGRDYLFNGSTHGMLSLDRVSKAVVDFHMQHGGAGPDTIRAALTGQFPEADLEAALGEIVEEGLFGAAPPGPPPPSRPMPLSTMVLHVAQDCNLACTYCYADEGQYGGPKKMITAEVASKALDFLIERGADKVNVTFFGGEPLMNWPVMKQIILEGEEKAKAAGKRIDFSFTTNATLLTEERVDFLAEHRVGVSISMDGPPDIHDANRPTKGGTASYAMIEPKVKMLLARHKTRPIGARVTMSHGTAEPKRIFEHLIQMGFSEVGLSPVTSPLDSIFLHPDELDTVLTEMKEIAERALFHALRDEYLGFSNITNLWQELHEGLRKTYACGAGLGLLSVSVDGKLYLCHRFNGVDGFQFGDITAGIDWEALGPFMAKVHVDHKEPCSGCWAKHVCGGGCYYEALVRLDDATSSNSHYCTFVQTWIETGLDTYARLWEGNPDFFDKIGPRKPTETSLWGGTE